MAEKRQPRRPAMTPEAREQQMIGYAVDLAEKQLREGTASAQVITHYLKLGSSKELLEKEILTAQKKLVEAKAEVIKSMKSQEELFKTAIAAFKTYSGQGNAEDEDIY